jgi:hypothetical protein
MAFLKSIILLKYFFVKMIYYSFSVAFWDLLNSQRHKIGIFSDMINEKKHSTIIRWLIKNNHNFIFDFIKRLSGSTASQDTIPAFIWICWWDGIDTMPPVVQACFNSVKKYSRLYNVTLITKYNFQNFVSIPHYILKKLHLGIITKTHFSDILRMALLAEYGGLWLDATILVTDTIQPLSVPFFTIKREYGGEDVPRRQWTGFCIGGVRNNILFTFAKEFFYEYWKRNNYMIDYFLIDYTIAIAYNTIPRIKQIIKDVRNSNPDLYCLQDNLENEFDFSFFEMIIKNTLFHKLTWKKQCIDVTVHNIFTYYGYILQQYGSHLPGEKP